MAWLIHKEKKWPLIKAQSLPQRLWGLIPHDSWPSDKLFWIHACSSVHTFFMSFPIDIFFTNSRFQITRLFERAPKSRLFFGGFKSRHAFEMRAGQIQQKQFKKGDQLYVES